MFTRAFSTIADVSATCLALVYLTECSSTIIVRCSALLGDISPIVLGDETLWENFNAMSWWSMAITRVRRWSFVELLAHGGAAQICVIFFIFKWEKCFLSCSLFWHYTVMASQPYYDIRRVLLWRSLSRRMQYLFLKRISFFFFFFRKL